MALQTFSICSSIGIRKLLIWDGNPKTLVNRKQVNRQNRYWDMYCNKPVYIENIQWEMKQMGFRR